MPYNNTAFPVSIILPNYNGRHLLEKNLPSIIEAAGQYEHEIIVVDDCS
ncbi:MAG: glycosyltransferase, partial [Gammaproteobacteria bacterium]